MASVKIKPLADRVVVEPLEETEEMRGGLYIPDTAKEKPQQGTVVAAGPGRRRVTVSCTASTRAPKSRSMGTSTSSSGSLMSWRFSTESVAERQRNDRKV